LIPAPVAPLDPIVTVLCYHTFNSHVPSAYTVSTPRFEEQLRFLKVQKIPVIPLSDLVAHIREGKPLPPQSAVITIDDGYKTASTVAWPILKKYGFPFTVYVYPNAISRFGNAMTWDEVITMSNAGVDIQSHTMTHPLLTHPPRAMSVQEYTSWLEVELRGSRELLEKKLGKPVQHLAYSYGGYDEFVLARTKAAGYLSATTCALAQADRFVDPFLINRKLVFSSTRAKRFARYFTSRNVHLKDLKPRDGQKLDTPPAEISAKVVFPEEIDTATIQVQVDKLGKAWHGMKYDKATQRISFKVGPTDKTGYYFLSVSAKDKQNPHITREASWLFRVKNKPR